MIRISFTQPPGEDNRDAFSSVTAVLFLKDRCNHRAQDSVVHDRLVAGGLGLSPLVVRGSIDVEDLADPLDRLIGAGVINEPEADHQFVSSAKYFAALRKMSRSSRSFAFSTSNCRKRSAVVTSPAGSSFSG